jgi:DNA-binding NarL/FixJ family response regulator
MRDGLKAVLMAMPQIGAIHQADNGLVAMSLMMEHYPDLALLDADLSDGECITMLKWIKEKYPQTQRLALVNDFYRQEIIRKTAGAEAILSRGSPTAALFATIDQLLTKYDNRYTTPLLNDRGGGSEGLISKETTRNG